MQATFGRAVDVVSVVFNLESFTPPPTPPLKGWGEAERGLFCDFCDFSVTFRESTSFRLTLFLLSKLGIDF